MNTQKVKFRKSHPDFAYFANDIACLSSDHVAKLVNEGFVIILPNDEEDEEENPLPKNLPARNVLFSAGYKDVKKIRESGDSILDAGISMPTLKKVKKFLEEYKEDSIPTTTEAPATTAENKE